MARTISRSWTLSFAWQTYTTIQLSSLSNTMTPVIRGRGWGTRLQISGSNFAKIFSISGQPPQAERCHLVARPQEIDDRGISEVERFLSPTRVCPFLTWALRIYTPARARTHTQVGEREMRMLLHDIKQSNHIFKKFFCKCECNEGFLRDERWQRTVLSMTTHNMYGGRTC